MYQRATQSAVGDAGWLRSRSIRAVSARRVLFEIALLIPATAGAMLLLRWLHVEWQPAGAVLCGLAGPAAMRALLRAGTDREFPSFLMRLLDSLAGLIGLLVACWASMLSHHFAYWVLRWREAAALGGTALMLSGALLALVYTHGRMAAEIEAREARLAGIRESALQARLRALQAQINPHFLFNALNMLAELTHSDPVATERLVTDLAWLLRYTLRSSAGSLVTLGQEVEAVERYLRIEQARLGDRLIVEIDVPAELEACEVPGLSLQPLVENAVKYAAQATSGRAVVSVDAQLVGRRLEITVEDNGPGLPADVLQRLDAKALVSLDEDRSDAGTGGAGGGLSNVQQRLALVYRGDARVFAEEVPEGTRLRMELPT